MAVLINFLSVGAHACLLDMRPRPFSVVVSMLLIAAVCTMAAAALAMVGGLGQLAWRGPDAAGGRAAQLIAALGLLTYAAVTLTH